MSEEWIRYIPQQWVGLVALLMLGVTLTTKLIEQYPTFAKLLPLGTWWHDRVKKRRGRVDLIAEDNEVISSLQTQIAELAESMKDVQDTLRCSRAWSVYDARWHHFVEVSTADQDDCVLPRHYDYFEFERIWRNDPLAAARLSYLEETLEGPK